MRNFGLGIFVSCILGCILIIFLRDNVIKPIHIEGVSTPTIYKITEIYDVHDGDTFKATIELPLGILYSGTIRCKGYDAYELNEPKGKPARDYLDKLSKVSQFYIGLEPRNNFDSFGRILGNVSYVKTDGTWISLDSDMRDKGFVNLKSPWSHKNDSE